ncbi:MAG TPA: hypothetical protein VF516_30835 [Kofleriaceae bacterium]
MIGLTVFAIGCGDNEEDPQYEVISPSICSTADGSVDGIFLLREHEFAIVCSGSTYSVYRFDERTHTSELIYRGPEAFDSGAAGDFLYSIGYDSLVHKPIIQGLRIAAGQASPLPILTATSNALESVDSIGLSSSYIYWSWLGVDSAITPQRGLSRVPLTGGAEEIIEPMSFIADYQVISELMVIGDGDMYSYGYPKLEMGDYSVAIAHFSVGDRRSETIFQQAQGAPAPRPWIGATSTHAIFSDTSVVPPKVYSLEGSKVYPEGKLRCPLDDRSVITGNVIVSYNFVACAPHDVTLVATDISSGEERYYRAQPGDLSVPDVPDFDKGIIGARNGWIYWANQNQLARVRAVH